MNKKFKVAITPNIHISIQHDSYPCKWGGISQSGQPMVTELEEFGKRVLDCLWTSIIQSRKDHLKNIDSLVRCALL